MAAVSDRGPGQTAYNQSYILSTQKEIGVILIRQMVTKQMVLDSSSGRMTQDPIITVQCIFLEYRISIPRFPPSPAMEIIQVREINTSCGLSLAVVTFLPQCLATKENTSRSDTELLEKGITFSRVIYRRCQICKFKMFKILSNHNKSIQITSAFNARRYGSFGPVRRTGLGRVIPLRGV